jgi:hypothetical protein
VSRRRKLPPLPPGHVRQVATVVICTNEDQHPRIPIATVTGAPLPGQDPAAIWHQEVRGAAVDEWMDGTTGWRTYARYE